MPYVIEPAFGLTRALMAFLVDAYARGRGAQRQGRRRQAHGAAPRPPSRAREGGGASAVPQRAALARRAQLADDLRKHWNVDFDDAGAIGRRYRRQDEIGTPFCVTVDFDTLDDKAVTVRERDTMAQERVPLDGLHGYLSPRLKEF